jgi:hypothetical protein
MEEAALAQALKKAQKEGRTIVFIDESGLSERPHRCRTWAPRGKTPVLQYHFNWKTLSAMAGATWWNFYFRLFPGSIRSPQVVEFLHHLLRHLPGKLLIIWDGLRSHRSRMVWDFVRLRTLASKMNNPFCEVDIRSQKDLPLHEIKNIPNRLQETADFLEHFVSWDWSIRERNSRNRVIAVLRSEIQSRTGRPHDAELSALVDATFRAAGREEGCYIDATALNQMEKREKESRVKTARRLRSLGGGPYQFFL